jgi:hypothetical protein
MLAARLSRRKASQSITAAVNYFGRLGGRFDTHTPYVDRFDPGCVVDDPRTIFDEKMPIFRFRMRRFGLTPGG